MSRVRKVATFLAFNLLFFALYLNFVHSDVHLTNDHPAVLNRDVPAFGETQLVKNPEQYSSPVGTTITQPKSQLN